LTLEGVQINFNDTQFA